MTPLEFTRGVEGWEARWRRDAELQCWKVSHIMSAAMGKKAPTHKRLINAFFGTKRVTKGAATEEAKEKARAELRKVSSPGKQQSPDQVRAELFQDMKASGHVRSRHGS